MILWQIKDETGGDFGRMLKYIVEEPVTLQVDLLYKSMRGLGSNKNVLTAVLALADKARVDEIKRVYKKKYKKDLVDVVKSETSGDYKKAIKIIVSGAKKDNSEQKASKTEAVELAERLYAGSEGKGGSGIDILTFLTVLCTNSPRQLDLVVKEYKKLSESTLKDVVASRIGEPGKSDLGTLLHAMVAPPEEVIAVQLNKAMAGFGADESAIARLLAGNPRELGEKVAAKFD